MKTRDDTEWNPDNALRHICMVRQCLGSRPKDLGRLQSLIFLFLVYFFFVDF